MQLSLKHLNQTPYLFHSSAPSLLGQVKPTGILLNLALDLSVIPVWQFVTINQVTPAEQALYLSDLQPETERGNESWVGSFCCWTDPEIRHRVEFCWMYNPEAPSPSCSLLRALGEMLHGTEQQTARGLP